VAQVGLVKTGKSITVFLKEEYVKVVAAQTVEIFTVVNTTSYYILPVDNSSYGSVILRLASKRNWNFQMDKYNHLVY
jgi:hypothetical protein